jgi:ribonuclease P protein component
VKAAVGAYRLSRDARLTKPSDIQTVFQDGRREERRAFVLLWRPRTGAARAGFAVSRQIRGAVDRNRGKRRLREAYRRLAARPAGLDLVFVARAAALAVDAAELEREMAHALAAAAARR